VAEPTSAGTDTAQSVHDPLDDEAKRTRIRARAALVDEGDYFAVLGVTREATAYDIRRAYLDLRREFEPARMLSPQIADMRDDVMRVLDVVTEAYEILRDTNRRERYRKAISAVPFA
jgi:curved DNA-binding protein CbpA